MPRLVHLNGPPGIGKSTLALRYVEDHPLAFCLDIDAFRRLIGRWDEHEKASGELARRMALAMAAEHLRGGLDVVVPQFVARPPFAHQLEQVATRSGASFHELVLLQARDQAEARFHARADDARWSAHHADAARMIEHAGGYGAMYDALVAAIPSLPSPVRIMLDADDVDGSYRSVLLALVS